MRFCNCPCRSCAILLRASEFAAVDLVLSLAHMHCRLRALQSVTYLAAKRRSGTPAWRAHNCYTICVVGLQESSPRFVPARGWQGYDTRSVLQLQEAWEAPMLLSPKRLVSLSHAEFTCLWQVGFPVLLFKPCKMLECSGCVLAASAPLYLVVHQLRDTG